MYSDERFWCVFHLWQIKYLNRYTLVKMTMMWNTLDCYQLVLQWQNHFVWPCFSWKRSKISRLLQSNSALEKVSEILPPSASPYTKHIFFKKVAVIVSQVYKSCNVQYTISAGCSVVLYFVSNFIFLSYHH